MEVVYPETTIRDAISDTIHALGYDLDDPNFIDTPERAMEWLKSFAKINENAFLEDTLHPVFPEDHDEMVIVGPTPFVSICPHHLIPYSGVAHVGYIPSEGVVGISKLARVVQGIAHQCVMQERTTRVVADGIHEILKCKGVIVVLEASHGCMEHRGVRAIGSKTITSAVRGIFSTNQDGCKDEFLRLIGR